VAVRELIVPQSAPPFDDDPPGPLPGDEPPWPAPPADDRPRDAAGGERGAGPSLDADPDQDRWPGQFAQVLAETLAGSRPPGQIVPWTTDQARRRIRQLGPLLAAGQQPRLRRVIASSPAAGVVELTVVAVFGRRVRALAVRLEQGGAGPPPPGPVTGCPRRWRCTTVEAA
jgi:hypothetical protein